MNNDFQTAPTSHEAHAAVDLLISGFTSDQDARLYLTDLVRMIALAAPTQAAFWARQIMESRS